jgi:small-conductance mechanosensitive channel
MPWWERLTILAVVVLASLVLAKLVDRRIQRHELTAGATTRYRILRRSLVAAIITIAVLAGLLVIPQVRAVAGTLLASGAILGLIIGFASQRTLSNFVAGVLIAFTQPLRIGDWIVIDGTEGVVEEIRLTYTFVRSDDDTRLVIPNDKLVSDTIRNSTIVDRAQKAEITVQVPLSADLESVIDLLRTACQGERELEVFVSNIENNATITLRALAPDPVDAERLEHGLRLRAHSRLREAGIYA